jgi:hypothetical protein
MYEKHHKEFRLVEAKALEELRQRTIATIEQALLALQKPHPVQNKQTKLGDKKIADLCNVLHQHVQVLLKSNFTEKDIMACQQACHEEINKTTYDVLRQPLTPYEKIMHALTSMLQTFTGLLTTKSYKIFFTKQLNDFNKSIVELNQYTTSQIDGPIAFAYPVLSVPDGVIDAPIEVTSLAVVIDDKRMLIDDIKEKIDALRPNLPHPAYNRQKTALILDLDLAIKDYQHHGLAFDQFKERCLRALQEHPVHLQEKPIDISSTKNIKSEMHRGRLMFSFQMELKHFKTMIENLETPEPTSTLTATKSSG